MAELNSKERELVALGAALGSNCKPCIEVHVPAARKAGLSDRQIDEAIRLADRVRQVPARLALEAALAALPKAGAEGQADPSGSDCARSTPAAATEQPCCTS